VRDRWEQIIEEVAAEHDWTIIRLAIQPDPVQLCMRAKPYTRPSEISRSAHDVREAFPPRRKRPSRWTRSFFLSTAGSVSQAIIQKYRALQDVSEVKTTVPVGVSPTPEQAARLRTHWQEYLRTIHVLVPALDSEVLPEGGKGTQDVTAALPRAVKHQARRAHRREPCVCAWRAPAPAVVPPDWRVAGERLLLAICHDGARVPFAAPPWR